MIVKAVSSRSGDVVHVGSLRAFPTYPEPLGVSAAGVDSLPVAGLTPFSMVDWPGKLVATVFTQGCSWRCPYCHNPDLQDVQRGGATSWHEVLDFAQSRVGMLDGVVFSGGEPTRHRGLGKAMQELHELGFSIGLHTNGMYPGLLQSVLQMGVVEWVGLDIKAGRNAYDVAIGRPGHNCSGSFTMLNRNPADVVAQCLDLVQKWASSAPSREFEVRTTLYDDPRIAASLKSLAQNLADRSIAAHGAGRADIDIPASHMSEDDGSIGSVTSNGRGSWVLQRVREQGTSAQFKDLTSVGAHVNWDDVIAEIRTIFPAVKVR